MGKIFDVEYKDVEVFHRDLKKIIDSNRVDDIFINSCEKAMDNTIYEAESRTPVKTGELISSWRKDIEKPKRDGKGFSQTAINKAFNEEAAAMNMEGHYASFVEEGHKKVPWRKNTYGVHMLAQAEQETDNVLEQIVDKEIKKLLGGLFD